MRPRCVVVLALAAVVALRPARMLTRRLAPSRLRARTLAASVLAVALTVPAVAAADAIFVPPEPSKARTGGTSEAPTLFSLLADAQILGVAGARRLAAWPDRHLGLEPGGPAAVAVHAGGLARLASAPVTFVLRADLVEPTRPDEPRARSAGAWVGAVVEDAYVHWHPRAAAELVAGRARVPFSRARHWDDTSDPLGVAPFVVDRIAPDRRTGLLFHGDLGALGYAAGLYEDLDALEPRAIVDDPSAEGMLAAAAHVEWTPRAPIFGSNPIGRIAGAHGPGPTPASDPWYDTARFSLGLGLLGRVRDDDTTRLDGSASLQLKWRALGALLEVIATREPRAADEETDAVCASGSARCGAHLSLHAAVTDRLVLSLRGEWDAGAAGGTAAATGGVSWAVTADGRNRVALVGWVRRDARGTPLDAAVVLLQASL